ncbi:hypothetical protein THRCLA_08276 [Thraustotheca clavata]|uniref:Uncharacterized protein n=1 Tax=Thraustotheca clavata TaxID=74557 RepID=A0A1V9Z7X7_9STRA|nr:hypothetical protein THRCLA_08276 [Thraustotheca clavata]
MGMYSKKTFASDLPPLEVIEEEELNELNQTKYANSKANDVFAYGVLTLLTLYVCACFFAYMFPPEPIPWEIEFALPYDPSKMTSNCSAIIRNPMEGDITSKRVVEYDIYAPSNTTTFSQVLQFTIYIDNVLLMTDLAILPRNEFIPYSTKLNDLPYGYHEISIELTVPLPGGYEEITQWNRSFHVPEGSKIVKVNLPKLQPKAPPKVIKLALSDLITTSRPRILSPQNGSVLRYHQDLPFIQLNFIHHKDHNTTILLNGRATTFDIRELSYPIAKVYINGLSSGSYIVTLVVNNYAVDHVSFNITNI